LPDAALVDIVGVTLRLETVFLSGRHQGGAPTALSVHEGLGLERVEQPEEGPEPRVPGEHAPADLACTFHDLAGDLDEGGQETAELHPQ
jgi:hypothetical protein